MKLKKFKIIFSMSKTYFLVSPHSQNYLKFMSRAKKEILDKEDFQRKLILVCYKAFLELKKTSPKFKEKEFENCYFTIKDKEGIEILSFETQIEEDKETKEKSVLALFSSKYIERKHLKRKVISYKEIYDDLNQIFKLLKIN